jgi:hypothetical protein
MTTARTFTTTDADRLLELADQFLQDWTETVRRHGEPAAECEERAAEWEAIRPLLAHAPQFLALLNEAETLWGNEFASDDPIDGGDFVEWFGEWLPKVRTAVAGFRGQGAIASKGRER